MIRASDLVLYGEFDKFIFYGKEKLPSTIIKTKYGEFDLSAIDWEKAKNIKTCGGDYYYDYGYALCQVLNNPNASIISLLLEKVCRVEFFQSENDKLLYVFMEAKK